MTTDNFIPELWSDKLLTRLKKDMVYRQCVNTDYEGEIKQFGDTVRINTVGPVTISNYTKNTVNLTPEVINGAGEPMVIDQAKYFYFALDDVDKAQVKGAVMDGAMDEASYGLRDTTDQFIASTMAAVLGTATNTMYNGATLSSTTNPILLGTSSGVTDAYELLVDISTLMNKNNVPGGNRFIVVPPDYVGLLLKDPRFTSFATAGAVQTAKEGSSAGGEMGNLGGILKLLSGLDVYVSNNVPQTGTSPNIIHTILAGYKGATSFADQIPEGQPEAFRLQTGFADAVRGIHLYGAKVFRPAALVGAYVQFDV